MKLKKEIYMYSTIIYSSILQEDDRALKGIKY